MRAMVQRRLRPHHGGYNAEMNRRLYAAAARIPDPSGGRSAACSGARCTARCAICVGRPGVDVALRQLAKPAIQKDSATMVADFDELRRCGRRRRADFGLGRRVTDDWLAGI